MSGAVAVLEMSAEDVAARRSAGEKLAFVDVREPWETEICALDGSFKIPLASLPQRLDGLPQEIPLVVVCHHGARSMQAVMWLRSQGFDNAVNLRGGIDAWARTVDPMMATY